MSMPMEDIDEIKRIAREKGVFRFKKFELRDDRSTMKVGTDALVLGIAVRVKGTASILDVGTGCGIIALVLAQRSEARIDAVEIDESSAMQASSNFAGSPWSDRLTSFHCSIQDFHPERKVPFDLIVSNPPFYSRSFKSGNPRKDLARHDIHLSFGELAMHSEKLLTPEGSLWTIVPVISARELIVACARYGLYPCSILDIIPKEGKPANRMVIEFGRNKPGDIETSTLTLRDRHDAFSRDFMEYAHEFYIDF